jgi:CRISPR-associated protein Cmr6
MDYPIPKASADAWRKHSGQSLQNPGLVFDRFAPDWNGQPTLKKGGLAAVRDAMPKADQALLQAWNMRWQAAAQAISAGIFTLQTDWRFVTGLGRKGPLEVGFTFHRYGFPILPGSSVKGIARACGLLQVADQLSATELKKLDELLGEEKPEKYDQAFAEQYPQASASARAMAGQFREIFGTTGAAGQGVFLDAIPASLPKLDLDIMNPHFPDYYSDPQGWTPPTDWQSPRPVYFLTVAAHTEFHFAVGWRRPLDADTLRLRDLAKDWLVTGLTELGAGAKTSAGYGYFQPPKSAPTPQPSAKIEATQTVPPVPPVERKTSKGKVRYDRGQAYIVDQSDPSKRSRVNWQELGMNSLADKTPVEYIYEEGAGGRRKVIQVTKGLRL